jgi:hypothetical protein
MFEVKFVCCDAACAEEQSVMVESLEDLERLCDCGFGLVLLDIAAVELV